MSQLRPLWIWLPVAAALTVVSIGNVLTHYALESVLSVLPWIICLGVPLSFATCWRATDHAWRFGRSLIEATLLGELMLILTVLYTSTHADPQSMHWRDATLTFFNVYIPLLIACSAITMARHARTINALPRVTAAAVWTTGLVPALLHGLFVLRLLLSW